MRLPEEADDMEVSLEQRAAQYILLPETGM